MRRLFVLLWIATTTMIPAVAQQQADSGEWNLITYAEAYLSESSEVADQLDLIDDSEAAIESARIKKESDFSIDTLELQLEVARLKVRELENAAILDAVDLYIAYTSAIRNLEAARASHRIAEQESAIMQNRYDADEASERELLQEQISLLQSARSLATAEQQAESAENSLRRALDIRPTESIVAMVPHADPFEDATALDGSAIKAASSTYYQQSRTVALLERELVAKRNAGVYTPAEIADIEEELEHASDQLQSTVWNLEDRQTALIGNLAGISRDLEIATIQRKVNETAFDSTELQYEFGEVLKTDLESASLLLLESDQSIETVYERLLTSLLEAADLQGEHCLSVLSDLATRYQVE